MSGKTIFIITITVLLTIVLMNNRDDMELWLFGASRMPKLAVLGTVLGIGFALGFVAGRPKTRQEVPPQDLDDRNDGPYLKEQRPELSDEDRDYIS